MKKIGKIFLRLLIVLVALAILFFAVRFAGKTINNKTPTGGINESMYVEINGTRQWISIYGKDINNPVLLYLHGGPGSSTSTYDYVFTRKWADVYTVVTWDQRNCGKSYSAEQNDTALTYDMLMTDGVEMTEFLRDYLKKDKITLLGHSWGTVYGCNLVLEHPEYYDAYIGTGQLVDFYENEVAFKEAAAKWVDNEEDRLLVDRLTVGHFSSEYLVARNTLMEKYGYGLFAQGRDYSMAAAQIFNPYYSLADYKNYLFSDGTVFLDFLNSDEFGKFSLSERTVYQVPFYNINGDRDYQTNYLLAQEYFDTIEAPHKKMYIMKDTTHGLLESRTKEFSTILHEIAEIKN